MKYECMHDCTSGGAGGPVGRDEAVDDRKKYESVVKMRLANTSKPETNEQRGPTRAESLGT